MGSMLSIPRLLDLHELTVSVFGIYAPSFHRPLRMRPLGRRRLAGAELGNTSKHLMVRLGVLCPTAYLFVFFAIWIPSADTHLANCACSRRFIMDEPSVAVPGCVAKRHH